MKKVALSLAVIATLALVSCGNKAKTQDTDTQKDTTTVEMTEPTMSDTDSQKDTATVKAEAAEQTPAETPAAPAETPAK